MRSINFRLIIRITLILVSTVGVSLFVPGFLALFMGDAATARAFFLPGAIAILPGLPAMLLLKGSRSFLGPREGFLMVSLGWVLVSVLGAVPFVLSGVTPNPVDALFETMSGFTTTGASIFSDVEILPPAILLWRSLTHWLGGVGVIALTVAILPALGISGLNLMRAETPGHDVDKVTPKLAETAKIVWLIYVVLTIIQILLLWWGGMSFFDAVNHAFATMATGGFSTKNTSLLWWDSPWLNWVCTIFMFLAGTNFLLFYRALRGEFRALAENSEFKSYGFIATACISLLTLGIWLPGTVPDLWRAMEHSAFQVATVMTTTGFMSMDFALWPYFAQAVLFLLMFIGASTGSTAGGVKVFRVMGMAKLARHEARMMLHPHGVFSIRINGQSVRKDLVYPMAAFVFVYMGILLVSTLLVSLGGYDLITSLTASLATLGNIGPGLAAVGPANNYGAFPDTLKLLFFFLMLLGRLELFTVLVIFLPRFWRR